MKASATPMSATNAAETAAANAMLTESWWRALDIDWRACKLAHDSGTVVSIGPDAHSPQGLEHLEMGVAVARKGWLTAADVLNSRTADQVLAFARARRSGGSAPLTSMSNTVASR